MSSLWVNWLFYKSVVDNASDTVLLCQKYLESCRAELHRSLKLKLKIQFHSSTVPQASLPVLSSHMGPDDCVLEGEGCPVHYGIFSSSLASTFEMPVVLPS